jgi:hypothetical protein
LLTITDRAENGGWTNGSFAEIAFHLAGTPLEMIADGLIDFEKGFFNHIF